MQFTVYQNIQALKGQLLDQSFPTYSSTPGKDRINPGFSFNMYSDIVPLNYGQDSGHKVHPKDTEIMQSQSVENQTGSGLSSEEIKYSFLHPRPIRTEILYTKKQPMKRSIDSIDSSKEKDVKKSKKKHKFQLV